MLTRFLTQSSFIVNGRKLWLGSIFIFLSFAAIGQITTGGSGNWSSTTLNAPWAGGVVPVAGQTVTINNGHIVTLNVNTAATLTSITINSGGTLRTTGAFTVNATTITVNGTYRNQSTGAVTVTNWAVGGTGTYEHDLNGGTIPVASGTRTWAATSNCLINGVTNTAPAPAGFAVPAPGFGNLTWDSPGQTTSAYLEASFNVQGDFSVLDTGLPIAPATRTLRMSPNGSSYTINVAGNFLVDASTFKMNNSSGSCALNVGGNVTVSNGGNLTLSTGAATSTLTVSNDVFVQTGATLNLQEDNNPGVFGILDIKGDLTIDPGTFLIEEDPGGGTGELRFTGSGPQSVTNNGTFSGLVDVFINQSPASTVTLLSPTNFPANLTITAGTLDTNGQTVTFDGTTAQVISSPAASVTFDNVVLSKTGGTLLSTGGGITTLNVGDLTQTTGNFTSPTTLTASGGITLTSGTFTAGTNTNVGGNWTRNGGTFTSGTNTTFNGTGAQVIGGSQGTTFNNVATGSSTNTSTAAAITINGDLDIADGTSLSIGGFDFSVAGSTDVGAGASGSLSISSAAGNKTFTGLVDIGANASWNNSGNSALTFQNGIGKNASATFTAGSGLYTFNTNPQSLTGTFSIPNVTASGITLTNDGDLTVATALSGTALTQSANATLNIGGTSTITTLTASALDNTVNYTGAAQTVHNINFFNLGLSGSGVKTLQAGTTSIQGDLSLSGTASTTAVTALTISGDVVLGAGATLSGGAFTHNVVGNWTNNGGTFNGGAGTVNFNGGGAQTINGSAVTQSFNNVTLNKGGGALTVGGSTATLSLANFTQTTGDFNAPATLNASGSITISSNTYTVGANTNVAGNFTHNGGTFTAGAGTVTFNGAGQAINGSATTTFNNVTIGATSSTTVSTPAIVNSALSILDGGTLIVGGNDFTVNGLTTVGGGTSGGIIFSSPAGTKLFDGLVVISSGATWNNAGNSGITFHGGITSSGTFTSGSGTHLFNSTSPQFLNGSMSIATVDVSGINLTNQGNLVVRANLLGSGTFTQDAGSSLTLNNLATIATFDATGANNTVTYSGSGQDVLIADYENLVINQSGGEAILVGNIDVNRILTLNARNLNLNGYLLTIGATGSIAPVAFSSSRMIIASGGGELRKVYTANGSFGFPIGDNSGMLEYSPVTVNVTASGGYSSAYIGASVTDAKHPNNVSSTHFISRYWEIAQSGITTPTVTVTGTYVAGDINGTQTSANSARLSGTFNQVSNPWTKSPEALGGNTLTFTGSSLPSGINAFTGITGADPVITVDNPTQPVELCEDTQVTINTSVSGADGSVIYDWTGPYLTDFSSTAAADPIFTG
ncbi:MAG: beta strand repeat-containing protein, partial [Cyclobacteriaceae bacterium]